jgi:hypothetical protein
MPAKEVNAGKPNSGEPAKEYNPRFWPCQLRDYFSITEMSYTSVLDRSTRTLQVDSLCNARRHNMSHTCVPFKIQGECCRLTHFAMHCKAEVSHTCVVSYNSCMIKKNMNELMQVDTLVNARQREMSHTFMFNEGAGRGFASVTSHCTINGKVAQEYPTHGQNTRAEPQIILWL